MPPPTFDGEYLIMCLQLLKARNSFYKSRPIVSSELPMHPVQKGSLGVARECGLTGDEAADHVQCVLWQVAADRRPLPGVHLPGGAQTHSHLLAAQTALLAGGVALLAGNPTLLAGGPALLAGGAALLAGGAALLAGGAALLAGNPTLLAGGPALLAGGAALLAGGAELLAGGMALLAGGTAVFAGGSVVITGMSSICSRGRLKTHSFPTRGTPNCEVTAVKPSCGQKDSTAALSDGIPVY